VPFIFVALQQIGLQVGKPGGSGKRDVENFVALNPIRLTSGRDVPWPFGEARHPRSAFPSRRFFAAKWGIASVWEEHKFIAVVRAVNDDRIVFDVEVFELLEYGADRGSAIVMVAKPAKRAQVTIDVN